MHLERCTRRKGGTEYGYWRLMESYRTERGPRKRVVGYRDLDELAREGLKQAAEHLNEAQKQHQLNLFQSQQP